MTIVSLAVEPSRAATTIGRVTYTGEGFEACTAPSTASMSAWLQSPYRAVGVYIGGLNRGCSQPNLTSSWVSTVIGQGWVLIPTYVGRQAPCNTRATYTIDPAIATTQGQNAAQDAVNKAGPLGIGVGSPIYFDMEAYSTATTSCVNAVNTFLGAWTERLHTLGYVSGVYGSSGSTVTKLSSACSNASYECPDDIWWAHWNDDHDVYGDTAYFPDTRWTNHHRIHQYHGGHQETWGGVTINIDNDALDADVVGNTSGPAATVTSPSWGALVHDTVSIAATASDDVAVTQVEMLVDGVVVGTDAVAPYQGSWDSTGSLDGAHTIAARASDADGNTFTSGGVVVTLDNRAPAAAVASTGSLVSPVAVSFDEDVHGVRTSNVVLRRTGSSTNLAATLACENAAGASVGCAAGPVRSMTLNVAQPLTPGQHYTAIVAPAGAPAISDLAGNAVAVTTRAFRGALAQGQGSLAATYGWRGVATSAAYGGFYRTAHLEGASATYDFSGTSITWYTRTSRAQGKARVWIDGVSKGTFNQYATSKHYKVARTFTGLGAGAHTIRIGVLGERGSSNGTGTYVTVDAFKAGSSAVDASPAVTYRWRTFASTHASGGSYVTEDLATAQVSFTFRGTAIGWYVVRASDGGKADVYVDGARVRTEDFYAASTTYGVKRSVTGLSDAVHTVKIVVLGTKRSASSGTRARIDGFVVT